MDGAMDSEAKGRQPKKIYRGTGAMSDTFFVQFASFLDQWRWPLVAVALLVLIRQLVAVDRDRRIFSVIMMGYFFLVIVAFWVIKPVKKAVFVAYYKAHGFAWFGVAWEPAQVELLAKELNVLAAVLGVLGLAWLSRRVRGAVYAMAVNGFYIVSLLFFIAALPQSGVVYVWLFYLFGDLFVITLVAIFFSFLHSHSSVRSSRRVYGFIGIGGVLGGLVGSASASGVSQAFGVGGAIATSAALLFGVLLLQYLAQRHAPTIEPAARGRRTTACAVERRDGLLALLHGARIVRHSRYLLMIAGILLLSEMASVLLDFQFTSAVIRDVPAEHYKAYFGAVYTFSNLVSLLVQLTLTAWLMRRYGARYALYVMPLVLLVATGAYLVVPVLLYASLLNTADNGFAYSVQQTAKESLYVPTANVEKYDAKAFIDIVWLRVAKGIAVLLGLALSAMQGSDTRLISLAILLIVAIWMVLAKKMARDYMSISGMQRELPVGGRHAA